jgi:hypothetical protein
LGNCHQALNKAELFFQVPNLAWVSEQFLIFEELVVLVDQDGGVVGDAADGHCLTEEAEAGKPHWVILELKDHSFEELLVVEADSSHAVESQRCIHGTEHLLLV